MKIAILGSAPSLQLAPIGHPDWQIWGCSPGVFPHCGTPHAWFELHRWEPGIIGKPGTQRPWFSPEYVQWMRELQCTVWMGQAQPDVPTSKALPVAELTSKYGTYFFTSTISWMIACAIEDILEDRATRAKDAGNATGPDVIGLWGVDMAATEEYGYQRAGCQHMLLLAAGLGIQVYTPPESDLLRPMPMYGISEHSHWHIKNTARRRELEHRLAVAKQNHDTVVRQIAFLEGALDDMAYQMSTWAEDRVGAGVSAEILAQMPAVRSLVLQPVGQDDTPQPPQRPGPWSEPERAPDAGATPTSAPWPFPQYEAATEIRIEPD